MPRVGESARDDRAGSVDAGEVREELERVLASPAFAASRGASRFLAYVVEETLAGRADQIKEYAVGVEVFDRGDQFDPRADGVVRVEANRLRKRLRHYYEDDGRSGPVLINLPKGQYVPVFQLREVAGGGPRPYQLSRRGVIAAAAGLAALALSLWWRQGGAPRAALVESIAVLPFANLSGDASQEYFADGMTEALIDQLGKIGEFRVISRSAVMQYKGGTKTLAETARELQAGLLVEGSVMRAGDRVRVTSRLVDPGTQRQLWSQSYERDLRDVLTLQNEVAAAIAAEIGSGFTLEDRARFGAVRAIHPEAYDSYLRGLYLARRENRANNEKAIELFEQAVSLDPSFAAAYAQLARSCVRRFFLFTPDEAQWEERAFVATRKALALDPGLAEAHRALGWLLWTPPQRFQHEAAIEKYRQALALNPNLEEGHHDLGFIYAHIGFLDEAIEELEHERAINPFSELVRLRIAQTLSYQSRHGEALAILETLSPGLNPPIMAFHTAWSLFQLGERDEAVARLNAIMSAYPSGAGGLVASLEAMLLAAAGDEAGAEAKIGAASERGKGYGHFHHAAYGIASAYALMRKSEKAVHWLEVAAGEGFPCYPLFEKDAMLDPIRNAPGFIAFLSQQKLQREQRGAALSL